MMKRIVALALLGGLITFAAAMPKTRPHRQLPSRTAQSMPSRMATHGEVADVLNKHFKGEAEVLAVPAGSGNALLISGTPMATEEVVKLLAALDRKPKTVEVTIVWPRFHQEGGREGGG